VCQWQHRLLLRDPEEIRVATISAKEGIRGGKRGVFFRVSGLNLTVGIEFILLNGFGTY
jgi:hypothetical protein